MKILIATDSLMGGGAEKLIADMAPRLKEQGAGVDILTLTGENAKYLDQLTENGIQIRSMDGNGGHIKRIIHVYHEMSNGEYDIVHANLFPMFYYVSLAARLMRKKKPVLVMTEHSTDNHRRQKRYLRSVERFIYRRYDKIISISGMTQTRLREWLQLPSKSDDKFTVIDNGVPVEEFSEAEAYSKSDLFPEYVPGDILLGMIGSFSTQKNHQAMLGVLKCLPDRYKLICAGEGSLMQRIQDEAVQMGLDDRIAFLGFRTDIAQVMHTVDVVVIPSVWEGFGLVAVEAMACGKPVIASGVPGLAEVVGHYGLLEDPNVPEKFASQIRTLEEKEVYDLYAEKSRQHANDYTIDRTVQSYKEVYIELMNL